MRAVSRTGMLQRTSHVLLARVGVAMTAAVALRSSASALHTTASTFATTPAAATTAAAQRTTMTTTTTAITAPPSLPLCAMAVRRMTRTGGIAGGAVTPLCLQQRYASSLCMHATPLCYDSNRTKSSGSCTSWLSRLCCFSKKQPQQQQQAVVTGAAAADEASATTAAKASNDSVTSSSSSSLPAHQRRRRLSPRARFVAMLRAALLRVHAMQHREMDAIIHETDAILSNMRAKLHAMMAKVHAAALRMRHKLPYFARTHILDDGGAGHGAHGLPSSSSTATAAETAAETSTPTQQQGNDKGK